jgi:low affinity Fe/Cu permease
MEKVRRPGHLLTRLGVYTANPLAFLVLIVYGALWYVFKPETFEWHAVATLATWGMTLVIQRAEHRDTQAIHAKLDEILHALGDARNEITRMDEEEPEEIERRRQQMREDELAPPIGWLSVGLGTAWNVEEHHLPECACPALKAGFC